MITRQCSAQLPIGAPWQFSEAAPLPPGFVRADGAAHLRTEYAALFRVIGTTFGAGDGSTTFNVPNITAQLPQMQVGIRTGSSADEQMQQLYYLDLARRLRDPEQYADACDEAANSIELFSSWVVGDFCSGRCGAR